MDLDSSTRRESERSLGPAIVRGFSWIVGFSETRKAFPSRPEDQSSRQRSFVVTPSRWE